MVRLTDRPDMTLDVYRGRKTQHNNNHWEPLVLGHILQGIRSLLQFIVPFNLDTPPRVVIGIVCHPFGPLSTYLDFIFGASLKLS